jgi:hypothetical protein
MCYVTGNASPGQSQGTNDVDNGKTTLFSPVYDLSGLPNAWVQYRRWYTNDTGSNVDDEWVVDVSADGGATWVRLETLVTSDRTWRLVERSLTDLIELTDQVQLRFIARDDDPGSIVEAGIDDFAIAVYEEPTTSVVAAAPGVAGAITLGQNTPNPFNPYTQIRLSIPEPGRKVTLRVFDVTGRAVRTLIDDRLVAGPMTVVWDGRDDRGAAVASAVYFYRLEAGEEALTRKLILMR